LMFFISRVVTSRQPQKTDTPTIKTTKKIGIHTKPYMKVDNITSKHKIYLQPNRTEIKQQQIYSTKHIKNTIQLR
jgi:hypothetical protein